jgi:hypothetical protein
VTEPLLVHNKADLAKPGPDRPAGLSTSAVTGEGTEQLLAAISRRLVCQPPPDRAAVPFTIRQKELLEGARGAVGRNDLALAMTQLSGLLN